MNFIEELRTAKGPYAGLSSNADTAQFPERYNLDHALNDMAVSTADKSDSRYILAVNGQGEPEYMDLSGESPHVLVSAASGRGKSTILRAVAAQALAKGDHVVILDIKQHSQSWAEGLDNVYIATSLVDIGKALALTGQEVHKRNTLAREWLHTQRALGNWDVSAEDAPVGPRIVVLFEEMNSTLDELRALTRAAFRNTQQYDAWNGMKDTVLMGRAARIHMVAVGQGMGARAVGGSEILVNFGHRILIGHDNNIWNRLAWDCGLPKAAPEEAGRGFMCHGGKAKMAQFLYMSEREARVYAETALSQPPTPSLVSPAVPATFNA